MKKKRGQVVRMALMHKDWSQYKLAQHCNMPRTTVQTILNRFKTRGVLRDMPRSGKPPTLLSAHIEWLDDYIHQHNNYPARRIADAMYQQYNIRVSPRTIARYRKQLGYYVRQVGSFAPTQQQRRLRVEWCTSHLDTDWSTYVFVDESQIILGDTGSIEWVKRGDPRQPRLVTNMRASVQLIMTIWPGGQYITAYDQQLNELVYANEFLSDGFYNLYTHLKRRTLLHDQASYHKSNYKCDLLTARGINYEFLPPRSPDLDPVD